MTLVRFSAKLQAIYMIQKNLHIQYTLKEVNESACNHVSKSWWEEVIICEDGRMFYIYL
jgi:hypothetical protein